MSDTWTLPPLTSPRGGGGATTSVLDKQVSINGTISSEGAIRIEGRVTGDVSARSVTLAQGAAIQGGVTADVAVIEGSLTGPLHAREARLTGTAHMEGEIVHSVLIVEAGAHFDGYCRRDGAAAKAAPATATAKPKADSPAEPPVSS